MRVAVGEIRVQTHDPEELTDAFAALFTITDTVNVQRLGDDRPDCHARIERRRGILKDHLHFAAMFA